MPYRNVWNTFSQLRLASVGTLFESHRDSKFADTAFWRAHPCPNSLYGSESMYVRLAQRLGAAQGPVTFPMGEVISVGTVPAAPRELHSTGFLYTTVKLVASDYLIQPGSCAYMSSKPHMQDTP